MINQNEYVIQRELEELRDKLKKLERDLEIERLLRYKYYKWPFYPTYSWEEWPNKWYNPYTIVC